MDRVIIIGSSGSGKTTLAKKLAAKTGLSLVHLDKIYWCGNWEHLSRDEFDEKLTAELKKDKWIIDGNYSRTLKMRLEPCDTVIYLDFPTYLSFYGALKRIITGYGKTRDDMGGNCPEKFDFQFFKFVITFNRENRKKYYELLDTCKDKKIIILKSRREVNRFIETL